MKNVKRSSEYENALRKIGVALSALLMKNRYTTITLRSKNRPNNVLPSSNLQSRTGKNDFVWDCQEVIFADY